MLVEVNKEKNQEDSKERFLLLNKNKSPDYLKDGTPQEDNKINIHINNNNEPNQ